MVARAFDEGRIGGVEPHHAKLCQIYGVLGSEAKDCDHELTWVWPLLGLADPNARPVDVIAWHREVELLSALPETDMKA